MRAECNGLVREAFRDIDLMACPSTIGPAYPVTPEALYGPMDSRARHGVPALHRALRLQRSSHALHSVRVQRRRPAAQPPVRGQAFVRAAAMQGGTRL